MKKKYVAPSKDKKDWIDFTERMENINPKEVDNLQKSNQTKRVRKLDLQLF